MVNVINRYPELSGQVPTGTNGFNPYLPCGGFMITNTIRISLNDELLVVQNKKKTKSGFSEPLVSGQIRQDKGEKMLKYNGNPPDISGGEKSNVLLALIVLIGLMILPQMAAAQFDPPWWNDNWLHRAEITLNPATPSDSFQVKVELTPSNFTYAHAQDDGDDLRFLYYNAAWFDLDYWIEEWNALGTSTI